MRGDRVSSGPENSHELNNRSPSVGPITRSSTIGVPVGWKSHYRKAGGGTQLPSSRKGWSQDRGVTSPPRGENMRRGGTTLRIHSEHPYPTEGTSTDRPKVQDRWDAKVVNGHEAEKRQVHKKNRESWQP